MKRVIYASINPNKAQIGEVYTLSSNITVGYVLDIETRQTLSGSKDEKHRWIDDFVEEIRAAADGNIAISKNKSTLKLTPGANLTVVGKLENRGKPSLRMQIGDSRYTIDLDPWNDLGKMALAGTPPKAPKEESDEMWAAYMVPDPYGRLDTDWHWTAKDYDETEKEFRARVNRQATNLAERSFREYLRGSAKKRFFKSKDAFIKFCNKEGFNPRLDD